MLPVRGKLLPEIVHRTKQFKYTHGWNLLEIDTGVHLCSIIPGTVPYPELTLFNTSQEHDTSIANINATISPIPSEITDLQNRVSALETQIPTPTPTPKTFTFFNGAISTSGATSPTFDTQGGYSKIQVTYQCSVGSVPIDIQASTDGNTWTSQENFPASYCLGGVETSLVLVGRYYRVVTVSTTDPSVSLTATG